MDGRVPAPSVALQRFQDDFARALFADDGGAGVAEAIAALTRQRGFAVYRNTVVKGCVDALHANYPAVARLVGDEWFRAAAVIYARTHLPTHPALVGYGGDFDRVLAGFEPARDLPYLPGVARLDRLWTEAHTAADESAVEASAVARLDMEALARAALVPLASARWAWFDTLPIFTIWQRNRATGAIDESDIAWQGEGALLVRPNGVVRWTGLAAGGCAFLDACAAGATVAEAGVAALAADPDVDLATLFAGLLDCGAFKSMTVRQPNDRGART
jgi:hypothetical protein